MVAQPCKSTGCLLRWDSPLRRARQCWQAPTSGSLHPVPVLARANEMSFRRLFSVLASVNLRPISLEGSARYHHGNLRRALLDAALAAIADHGGTAGVTIREAARRAGVSHNAPYRHFKDRDAMLSALAEEGFAELGRDLRAARERAKDPEARFLATGLAYLRFARTRAGHLTVMFGPERARSRSPDLQRAADATFQVLKHLALDAGITDVVEARRFGGLVWSFLHGLAVLAGQNQLPAAAGTQPEDVASAGLARLFRSAAARNPC